MAITAWARKKKIEGGWCRIVVFNCMKYTYAWNSRVCFFDTHDLKKKIFFNGNLWRPKAREMLERSSPKSSWGRCPSSLPYFPQPKIPGTHSTAGSTGGSILWHTGHRALTASLLPIEKKEHQETDFTDQLADHWASRTGLVSVFSPHIWVLSACLCSLCSACCSCLCWSAGHTWRCLQQVKSFKRSKEVKTAN